MSNSERTFEDKPATRERVPLMIGLMGPSGGGKTYSALRLATGIQRVAGGEIFMIDTEARRGLHYAERFKFRHLPFGQPFGPGDYLAAIQHCVKKGAGTIIVDSMSHEHEGPGGVLEMHDAELQKMGGRASDSFRAWAKPKAERRRMINTILQLPCNFIFCFRAKEKTKPGEENGEKKLLELGYMPIAGEEFVFEMTANALLLPNANGEPTWHSSFRGEKQMIKLPEQFVSILTTKDPKTGEVVGRQLTEDIGEALAKWAAGTGATFRGQGEWKGKPLADVPSDVLGKYRLALVGKPQHAAHLSEVDAVMAARVAADAGEDVPFDDDHGDEEAAQ